MQMSKVVVDEQIYRVDGTYGFGRYLCGSTLRGQRGKCLSGMCGRGRLVWQRRKWQIYPPSLNGLGMTVWGTATTTRALECTRDVELDASLAWLSVFIALET